MNCNFPIAERVFEVDSSYIAHCCLKRKLDVNSFTWITNDNGVTEQQPEFYTENKKRQRIANTDFDLEKSPRESFIEGPGNVQLCQNFHGATRNNEGIDSRLQNQLENTAVSDSKEVIGMEVESETTFGVADAVCSGNYSSDSSGTEKSSDKQSPVREFLQTHRPDCMVHCIPSYCHPGGLWDAMLEVYHGL